MKDMRDILNALLTEKKENAKRLSTSEYNDYYLGEREGLCFAINLITKALKENEDMIDLDDIENILEGEGWYMRKRRPYKGTILKRKATNAAKQSLYLAMWGKEAPGKYKKS